jgi:hypothetical protein
MDELATDTLDLNQLNTPLSERVRIYNKFAGQIEGLLLSLYQAGADVPINITGTTSQINSFSQALAREKRYMDSFLNHGLNDTRTLNSHHKLGDAVKKFENETGIRWPFKN